jgi:hypothetical protein
LITAVAPPADWELNRFEVEVAGLGAGYAAAGDATAASPFPVAGGRT